MCNGTITPDRLCRMSATELATPDQQALRSSHIKDSIDGSRSDYYQVNRADILKSVGVDPSKGGEFVCRKCGQNKTTHYALQTRSADEPMTVFVTCITCNNRWRTS